MTVWKSKTTGKLTYKGKKQGTIKYRKKGPRRNKPFNKTSVPLGLGFPKRMVMTHKYADFFNLTSTAGVINKYQFSCNGMYDPNITGTGHQPMYYDQMAALYNHYTVIGSRFKITVTPTTANTAIGYVGIYLDDDTSTSNINDLTSLAERTTGKIRQVSASRLTSTFFNAKWSAKKTFGGSILGNDLLQGSISANPTEQTYYTLAVIGGGASDVTFQILIEATYIAVWDELKDVAQS